MVPPAWRFPGGLRWRYFTAPRKGRKARWECCWSTTRNTHGKFISWVYVYTLDGEQAEAKNTREHAKRKDAKARALKLCRSRK